MIVEQVSDDVIKISLAGRQFLIPAECPHRKGRLKFGFINEERLRISCPLHRSTYDLETGLKSGGPGAQCLSVQEIGGPEL